MPKVDNSNYIKSIMQAVHDAPEVLTLEQIEEQFIDTRKGMTIKELILNGFPEDVITMYVNSQEANNPALASKYYGVIKLAVESVPQEKRGGVRLV